MAFIKNNCLRHQQLCEHISTRKALLFQTNSWYLRNTIPFLIHRTTANGILPFEFISPLYEYARLEPFARALLQCSHSQCVTSIQYKNI